MNSIDFFKYERFPLSSETLDFMQQLIKVTAKLSSMVGVNYILEGCIEAGSNVSAGVLVVNGEIVPFLGGSKETYIVIEETKRTVIAAGQIYEDIYISRIARFGTGVGQVAWGDIRRVPDLLTVSTNLDAVINELHEHKEDHRVDWQNIDDKPSVFPSSVLYSGSVLVGDIDHDKLQTVNFPSVNTSNYVVCGSLRSIGPDWNKDNDVFWIVKNKQDSSFQILLHETSTDIQSLYFDYALVKL